MVKRRKLIERCCIEYADALKLAIEDDIEWHVENLSVLPVDYEEGFVAGLRQALVDLDGFSKIAVEWVESGLPR